MQHPSLVENQPRNSVWEPENDVFRRGSTCSSIAAGFSSDNPEKPGTRGSRVPGAQKILEIKCSTLPSSITSLGTRCGPGNRKWRFSTSKHLQLDCCRIFVRQSGRTPLVPGCWEHRKCSKQSAAPSLVENQPLGTVPVAGNRKMTFFDVEAS